MDRLQLAEMQGPFYAQHPGQITRFPILRNTPLSSAAIKSSCWTRCGGGGRSAMKVSLR
jgi:hypothetical protein